MTQFQNNLSDGNYLTAITPRGLAHPMDSPETNVDNFPRTILGAERPAPGTVGSYERLVAQERENIERQKLTLPPKAIDSMFEKAISGEVDINTLFGDLTTTGELEIIPLGQYGMVKEAVSAEKSGTATPEQITLLENMRDPNGQVNIQFKEFARMSPDPRFKGFIDSGGFLLSPEGDLLLPPETEAKYISGPIDDITGERIYPFMGPLNEGLYFLGLGQKATIEDQAQGQARIREFIETREDGPSDPEIRDALIQTLGTDFADIFAERVYNLASVSELGFGYYVPKWTKTAYGFVRGSEFAENILGELETPTQTELAAELAEFKKSQFFSNRTTFVNDMIREQLFVLYGEEKFNRLGLGEKDEDGRFIRQFVGEKFSEDLFEAMWDDLHWGQKLGGYILEGVIAAKTVAAPFYVAGNLSRTMNRTYRAMFNYDIPIHLLPTRKMRDIAAGKVGTDLALDVTTKTRELVKQTANYRFFSNYRINSLARAVGREQTKINVAADRAGLNRKIVQRENEYNTAAARVAKIESEIRQAQKGEGTGNLDDLRDQLRIARDNFDVADENLRFTRAKRNHSIMRSWGIKLRESGFHPEFDLIFGAALVGGRNMFAGPRDPETGFPVEPQRALLGEGIAAVGFLGGLGVNALFRAKGVSDFTVGVAGERAPNLGFRARTFFEDNVMSPLLNGGKNGLFAIYRRGVGEGWLVNPTVKNIVFADAATRAKLRPGEQKQIQNFARVILSMPPEYQEPIFKSLDIFFEDTNTVMNILEPLVDGGVISMKEYSEYRQLLSTGFGETSALAILKAYSDMFNATAKSVKPGDIKNMKKRVTTIFKDAEHYKKRQGVLADVTRRLDEKVLKLEEVIRNNVEDPTRARQSIDILKAYSLSLNSAAEYHRVGYVNSIEAAIQEVDKHIEEIGSSELSDLQEIVAIEGVLDELLTTSARLESLKAGVETPQRDVAAARASGAIRMPDPNVPVSPQDALTAAKAEVEQLQTVGPMPAGETIRNKVDKLIGGMVRVASHTNLTYDEGTTLRQIDNLLLGAVQAADAGRFAEVTIAYDKVSNVRSIPLDTFANDVLNFLQLEFQKAGGLPNSFIAEMTPSRFDKKFGKLGTEFLEGMEKAARAGLLEYFSDAERLAQYSATRGKNIETAAEAIEDLKELGASYKFAREALGTDNQETLRGMSDLQLAIIMIRDKFAPGVDAASLNFIASPKELEELSRLAGRLTNDTEREVKNLGLSIQASVKTLLETHLGQFQGEQLNLLVTARTLHRAAMQRFDPGSFGYDVYNLKTDFGRLTGEGVKTGKKSVTRRESDLIMPMVKALLNPSDKTAGIVGETIERLQATLSPVRPAENLLMSTAAGGKRIPTTEELDTLLTREMSEETYNLLSGVIRVAVRNELQSVYKVDAMRGAWDAGVVPNIKYKKAADEIVLPSNYATLDEFFEATNEQLKVNVNGEMRLLFDIRDVYYASRDLGDTINASAELRKAHSELIAKIKRIAKEQKAAGTRTIERTKERAKTILKYSENATTGQGFFSNVINSEDGAALEKFLANLDADTSMNPAQKQAALQSLFIQVMKEVGGHSGGTAKIKLPDGRTVNGETYTRPGEIFFLFDDALNVADSRITGTNFMRFAEAAGIDVRTMEAYRAIFRLGFRESAPTIMQTRTSGVLDFAGSTKPGITVPRGYSIDNAIARAFNLARKMVSPSYVTAEAFVKYAAVAQGRLVKFLIDDPKAAEIMHALLTENRKIVEEEAAYFLDKFVRAAAQEVQPLIDKYDPQDDEYQRMYWESRGFIFDSPLDASP